MLTWRSILRGAITRFIPGVGTFLGVSYFINASRDELTLTSTQLSGFAVLTLCFTAGFIATISVMRPRLHDTARADGRRTFIAGLTSVAALIAMQVLYGAHISREAFQVLAMIASALTTFAVFFPRLRSRMAHLERAENGKLFADVVELAERGPLTDAAMKRRTHMT